jgi:hypothetical protein
VFILARNWVMAMIDSNHLLKFAESVKDLVIDFDARLEEILERLERIEAAIKNSPIRVVEKTFQNPDAWVDTKKAAKILGIAPGTLYNDRLLQNRRFPYSKVGKLVRYRVGDLIKLMEEHKIVDRSKRGSRP